VTHFQERIELRTNGKGFVEITDRIFRGAEYLYTLKVPNGGEVLCLVPSHHNHAIGERIGIRLDVEHVVVFSG